MPIKVTRRNAGVMENTGLWKAIEGHGKHGVVEGHRRSWKTRGCGRPWKQGANPAKNNLNLTGYKFFAQSILPPFLEKIRDMSRQTARMRFGSRRSTTPEIPPPSIPSSQHSEDETIDLTKPEVIDLTGDDEAQQWQEAQEWYTELMAEHDLTVSELNADIDMILDFCRNYNLGGKECHGQAPPRNCHHSRVEARLRRMVRDTEEATEEGRSFTRYRRGDFLKFAFVQE